MVKPLDRKGSRKWYGYLVELNNEPEPISLIESQIRRYVKGWKGHLIDPEKKTLTPIIETVDDQSIGLKFQNGNYRTCSYREIIDSEKVIRFWLAKGMVPESNDFRNSDPAILAEKISNTTYAPALAERIRKQLNIDHMIPPEVRILPMSPNEFKDENLNSISDVQEKFILGVLVSEERNGAYWYRHRALNAPEGTVALFQFKSHIIGSGVFLYTKPFDKPRGDHKGEIVFDVKSLRTFSPLNREKIQMFWLNFNNFSQALQRLKPESYIDFVASLNNVKFGPGNLHLEDDIERNVREALSAFEYENEHFKEGEKKYRYTSFYERDPKLRAEAVKFHGKAGVRCKVCGFDFEATYGSRGKGFIEVHHLKAVSSLGGSTNVNPETDMVLVCSNCHRMIHRKKDEILTIDQLKKLLI
ncbi:HNH endonuclease [uncultured Desulfobacter sp.]|uniref:HNH endonuclease n=1 Tax=uncultured Desulfobacter sp. TaxID=240139 RepID=UPI0029C876FE|nr:HNH endonuclease [uncultured Desulfobacter sp.]